jgi:hypothetical protein
MRGSDANARPEYEYDLVAVMNHTGTGAYLGHYTVDVSTGGSALFQKNVDGNRNTNGHKQWSHFPTTQASKDQQQCVVLVHCRRTYFLLDQKHQQSPRRSLERTRLSEIS